MLNGGGCSLIHHLTLNIHHLALATRDHRSDFNLIAVVEHLVLGYEIVAFDDQMRFDDEVQLAQEILHLLRAFDFYRSCRMAQLDLHGRIISRRYMMEQGRRIGKE
jgi:hypothetical protein